MNIDRAVIGFAGLMVLLSAVLAWLVSPSWLLLTAFVGLNLTQASITGFCPAAAIFGRLGLKAGCAFDSTR
jgi:Inner membrane protein YgaP-like, transmembrane domain